MSDMEVSPYLSAIQSLKGNTASEKYKELHSIASEVLKNNDKKTTFLQTGTLDDVPTTLHPTLSILIGMRLKSNEAVINALKSSDSSINKQGLKTKWFFKVSNSCIDIEFLKKELLPFISLHTRLELIKKLGKCLKAEPEKANIFYQQLVEMYGRDQTLPLLFACTEDFIYQEILRCKITFSSKRLKLLYDRYPQLAVRYLQLGNQNNKSNLKDRAVHTFDLAKYSSFFPYLLKRHTQEFVEFFGYLPERYMHYKSKIGITGTKLFLKNAADALIQKPRTFLPILSLKVVTEKLSKEQFDSMFQNVFPPEMETHCFHKLLDYLKYYPKEQVYELFSTKYKAVYGKDLLDHSKKFLDNSFIKDILPLNMRIECYKDYVKNKSDVESFLQPKEAVPLLKEKIEKTTEDDMKILHVSYMIYSCRLYEDKEGLLEVLKYYNNHLKNESAAVLQGFLERLYVLTDKSLFEKEHWKVLAEIIQRASITGDLFAKVKTDIDLDEFDPTIVLDTALNYFLRQCQKDDAEENDKQSLDTFVNIILEYFCEHDSKIRFIPKSMEVQKDCLLKFLLAVPLKYPENHDVWKDFVTKLELTSYLIRTMVSFNKNTTDKTKLSMQDYPWLKQFAKDLLQEKNIKSELIRSYASFKESLRRLDLDYYHNIIDNDVDLIYDVTANDGLIVLKKDAKKVLDKWSLYLSACKEGLVRGSKAARRFVGATKWYQEIPLKFVEQCLKKIDDKGNLLVLAILLEGEAFGKVVEPLLPRGMEVDGDVEEAKKSYKIISALPTALKFTNPPVPLDVLVPLCQDNFLTLAAQALTNLAQKTPVDIVLAFANKLINKSESVKNLGVGLVFQVATKPEVCKLLTQICKDEKCFKDKKTMAEMVFHLFKETPCEETWQLMKNFIQVLDANDKGILNVLQDIKVLDSMYASDYTKNLCMKINEFTELERNEKIELITSMVNQIENCAGVLSEDVLSYVIKEYIFDLSYDFVFNKYLFSDPEKFESRLDLIVEIITGTLTQLNEPHPKKPRLYPAKQRIHKFFSKKNLANLASKYDDAFDLHFCRDKNEEMKLRFIKRLLEIPSLKEDLSIYVNLNIYKIYFEESDPTKFGEKCGMNIKKLNEMLNKQYVLDHYGNTMRNLVRKYSVDSKKFRGKELAIIDGLKSCDLNVSISIGIKLLDSYRVEDYDERYNDFINIAKENCDLLSRTALNKFLAEVRDYSSDTDLGFATN